MSWKCQMPTAGGVAERRVGVQERVWSADLPRHAGERVLLAGWLHRLRQLRNVSFLVLRDASGLAQVVVEDSALAAELSALHPETVLEVVGEVVAVPQAPGGVEVHDPRITVVS